MAKKAKALKDLELPRDTKIEVIALCDGKKPVKKEMTYGQALNLPKKKGWKYIIYQLGYSQFKTE